MVLKELTIRLFSRKRMMIWFLEPYVIVNPSPVSYPRPSFILYDQHSIYNFSHAIFYDSPQEKQLWFDYCDLMSIVNPSRMSYPGSSFILYDFIDPILMFSTNHKKIKITKTCHQSNTLMINYGSWWSNISTTGLTRGIKDLPQSPCHPKKHLFLPSFDILSRLKLMGYLYNRLKMPKLWRCLKAFIKLAKK